MRRRTKQSCIALALAILCLVSTASVAEAGAAKAVTILTITSLKYLIVGEKSILAVSLVSKTPARIKAVPDVVIYFYVDDILERRVRTDSNGIAAFPVKRDLAVGSHRIRVMYQGSRWLFPSEATTTLVIKPAEVEIHTVPPLRGVSFLLAGRIFTSDTSGIARIKVAEPGPLSLEVLPLDTFQSNIQAEFDRWGDGVFTPSREVKIPPEKPLEVGFDVSYEVSPTFVDLADRPVDRRRIASLTIQGGGVTYVFQDGQPRWLLSSRVSRGVEGLEETKILYSVVSVEVDGANVVSEAQQRFHAQPNDVWPIKLLLYSVHLIPRDAMFHFPIGSGIVLDYPDGHSQEFPFNSSGELRIGSLARGLYHVTVTGAKGMAPPTPLALSRDQDLELLVLSNLDLSVMFAGAASLALGLLFFGRPYLLTILVRLPIYLFRKRPARPLREIPAFEILYTSTRRQCPACQATAKQAKAGLNRSGSQRYRCHICGRVYTPAPNPIGFSSEIRERALQLYLEGNSRRATAHMLNVSPRTISKWIVDHTLNLPAVRVHEPSDVVDSDDQSTSSA